MRALTRTSGRSPSLAHNTIQMHSADRTKRSSTALRAKQPGNTQRERERREGERGERKVKRLEKYLRGFGPPVCTAVTANWPPNDGKNRMKRKKCCQDGKERWKLETCMGWRENEIAKIPPFHEGKLSSKQKAITSLWGGHKNENNKQSNHACVYVCIRAFICSCVSVTRRAHTWSSVCTNKWCVHVFMYGDY